MAQQGIYLFAMALLGGLAPLVFRRTDRVLHLLIALTTGIFLGTLFLHMLPQVAELAEGWPDASTVPAHASEASFQHDAGEGHSSELWLFVLLGVVALFVIENLAIKANERPGQGHAAVGYASLLGLSLHALTSGFGLAATAHLPGLQTPLFVSILSHKAAESFSLTTVFLLAGFSHKRILALLFLFALVTPVGLLGGNLILSQVQEWFVAALTAFAVGTFLFVALYDLLPEVFHHPVDAGKKILLLCAGIGLTMWVHA
ncbi:MAG: zinc transporter ZupT [Chlamydiales bacterium]|jgi:zinc transporter ZupT